MSCAYIPGYIHYLILSAQVVSTHPYEGEDDDELTFEKGVVILVVPYEDPEDEVKLNHVSINWPSTVLITI